MTTCLLHLLAPAQTEVKNKIKFSTQTQVGYEYNFLKSPDKLIVDDVLLQAKDLVLSSVYQDIDVKFQYNIRWNKSEFNTQIRPIYKVYYQSMEDSYWNISVISKYNRNLSKNLNFLIRATYKKIIREGLDNDQDFIVNPLGFSSYGLVTGLQFQPLKNNKTTLGFLYNYRDFDATDIRDTNINEIGIYLNTEEQLVIANKIHSFGFKAFFKNITHETIILENQSLNRKRKWNYFKLNPFYQIAINKRIKVAPSFIYSSRIDKESTSSFTIFGPELKLKWMNQKTLATFTFSYLSRKYKDIYAQDSLGVIDEKATLNFVSFNVKAEHKLTKKIRLNASIFSRIRNTNNTSHRSRSFSHFRNQYAAIGLKWVL